MSMNPRNEDFERLALRWSEAAPTFSSYATMVEAITAFPERYVKERDKLPQNDSDRAFGLMARAAQIIDRSIVLADSEQAAASMAQQAASLLDEALKLDPTCYDARRISRYMARPTRDEMVVFLADAADDVRAGCLAVARENHMVPPDGHWSLSVYARPYLRWLLDLANEQLGCGRYRRALETCHTLLDLDNDDLVGARHVAAYVCVKLEDAEGLAELIGRYPQDTNAWFMLARCCMAYKQRRLDDAASLLHRIVRQFPSAGGTLTYQDELPPGVFGHLEYEDGTADELYVAVSEAAVILDENCGDYMSPLSDWIARDAVVNEARMAEEARSELERPRERERTAPPRTPRPPAPADLDPDALAFADITCVDDLLAAIQAPPTFPDATAPGSSLSSSGEAPQDPNAPIQGR